MKQRRSNYIWGAVIVVAILLAFILPYTVFSNVEDWYGSFLVWGIIGLIVIFANYMVTRDWGE